METFHHPDRYFQHISLFDLDDGIHIDQDGDIFYIKDHDYHREDGPAAIEYGIVKEWYINGNRHREDGPAVEWNDGRVEWWLNGTRFHEINDWLERVTMPEEDKTMFKLEYG